MQSDFYQPNKLLRLLVVALVTGLLLHFTFTIIYCFRDNMPRKANAIAERYMIPCFHQNWKLFAPNVPTYNVELEYRRMIENNDTTLLHDEYGKAFYFSQHGDTVYIADWTEWQDATQFADGTHPKKLETVEQGFCTQLGTQLINNLYTKNGQVQYDRIVGSPAYTSALYYVIRMHKREEVRQMHELKGSHLPVGGQLNYTPINVAWQIRLRYNFHYPADGMNQANTDYITFPEYYPLY